MDQIARRLEVKRGLGAQALEPLAKLGVTRVGSARKPELKGFAWQNGYAAFSVEPTEANGLIRYIDNQRDHHRQEDFKSEYLRLLKAHDIAYDERYVWD